MTDIYESIRRLFVPIHREGYPFIAIAAVAALILGLYVWEPLGWTLAVVALWICYFFRDPERVTPVRDGLVVAPADGRISMIATAVPPPETGLPAEPMARVSIFMNVFDCHVNRSPVTGQIQKIIYTPGLFLNAELDKASEDNERSGLIIEAPEGRFGVVSVAGFIARRIVNFRKAGDALAVGERFGLIRFGSRVDVYLPDGVRPIVAEGQHCIAGETVIADGRLSENHPRQFRTQ